MTVRSVEAESSLASVRMPGVASAALRSVMTGPEILARVLGSSSHAVWLLADDEVIVVSTRDATRLPNGIELPVEAAEGVFRSVHHGAVATIGSGRIAFDELSIDVGRWWDPRPALPNVHATVIAEAIGDLPTGIDRLRDIPLDGALMAASPIDLVGVSSALLGRGPGLTPEGDDYLAGALAATRLFGEATDDRRAIRMLDAASRDILSLARARTSTFSADLISHATQGNVALPAAALIRAIAGRGDIEASHRDLLAVGHTSGPALAAGIVLGAQALSRSIQSSTGGM